MRNAVIALLLVAAAAHPDQATVQRLGTIVFPNSGKAEAQAAFLRGVALLHNFAYPQAAKAFQEAERIDPNFALAYWGEAMTHNHPLWYQYDKDAGHSALARMPAKPADPRERGYIEAVEALYGDASDHNRAYERAMERLARANPDDVEAQAFWALSILGTKGRTETDPRKQIRAAAILEPLFAAHPEHPGVLHYLIHSYDDPVHAPLGLRAARRYSKVASDAPHALHMPSHIFPQLGMWDDAARSNEAAYALSKQWSEPDYHSLEWLQYVYLQQGRFAEAKKLVDETAKGEGERYHHARANMKARYVIESGEWDAFDFNDGHDAPFARGLQAVAHRDLDEARRAAAALKSVDEKAARPMEDELVAAIDEASGNMAEAMSKYQDAVGDEDLLGTPSGPPDDIKPAHEAFGEALLRAGKTKEAAAAFETSLLRTPNRRLSLAGAAKAGSSRD
jgi:tetratricopeptide (TPR) repeat protein